MNWYKWDEEERLTKYVLWAMHAEKHHYYIAAVHIFNFLQKSSLNLSFFVPPFLWLAVSEWAIILENLAINDKR